MKKLFSNSYLLLIIRLILGLIFIFASIEKIADPEKFSVSIDNYRMLPEILINMFAITLPWIELICGIFILFGIRGRESSIIIAGLLSVFTIGVFFALVRGLNIDCGCFGTIMAEKVGLQKIFENSVLLFFSVIITLYGSGKYVLINKLEILD